MDTTAEADPGAYFDSYEDLKIHELMLTDEPRQTAYQNAILGNRQLFAGKTVLDCVRSLNRSDL